MSETATDGINIPKWNLSDRLRKSLEHAGVEIDDMAQYLELHPNTIRNWIARRTRPRASDLKLWAMRTGVSYPWLTYGDPPFGGDSGLPRGDSNSQSADMERDHQPITRSDILSMRKALPIGVPHIVQSVSSR